MNRIYKPGEFAEKIGKSVQTLRKWDKSGKLSAKRTPGNQRFYTESQLKQVLWSEVEKDDREVVLYTRVSTRPQIKDLQKQQEKLEDFCASRGYVVNRKMSDVASGMNFRRKDFLRLMQMVKDQKISKIVISYKDRLCRFGFDFLVEYCGWFGTEIIVIDAQQNSPEQEFLEDMLAILHCFSSKSYSLRRKKSTLKKILSTG